MSARNINDDATLAYLFKKVWDAVYPIGSIYMSANRTSPERLFGGKWEQIKGRFLLGADETHQAGAVGGEENHTLTINEMPSHKHDLVRQQWYGADTVYGSSTGSIYSWKSGEGTGGSTSKSYHGGGSTVLEAGGGAAHNNMPPYLAVYMWKRTA